MDSLTIRFLRYVSYETTSDETQTKSPSTDGQFMLANALKDELTELGVDDVVVDNNGYLTATIPATIEKEVPVIGFLAHLDTSPEASGRQVKPRIVNFTGEDILLSEASGKVLSVSQFPELAKYKGQELIVTDGTTLLGADDKAGVAEIMTMAEYFLQHPEIEHGTIRIAFTPDEEVGGGADLLDVPAFNADWAYTVDGGELGELEFENFNAAAAELIIQGRGIHPGYAKDKMINASRVACEYMSMLPLNEVPEKTCGYEGFYHLTAMEGNVEQAKLKFIIRDHDRSLFEKRKETMRQLVETVSAKHEGVVMRLEIKDQYRNMIEKIKPVMHVVDIAKQAMMNCGVVPEVKPIRGGTDGANLSFKGLPCPNLFTGGMNFHGCYECIPVDSMKKAVDVLTEICKLVVK
ncbi:MAG: peptidase T [Paludibacteraceae bacterium]|nr:peptidase T [Paludibacteraceae bacterium]MEE3484817.1 peptidase T [Bacteroidales bacterium]